MRLGILESDRCADWEVLPLAACGKCAQPTRVFLRGTDTCARCILKARREAVKAAA